MQRVDGPVFLSNVNACYARACWAEVRFPDVAYAEDQAFSRAMLDAGWLKVYQPRAGVLHAHDYTPVEFMRRYFDEYRGLRETIGHVEPVSPRTVAGVTRRQLAGDLSWMRTQGWPARRRARWAGRSAVHHAGRQLFAGLGSRAQWLAGEAPASGSRSSVATARRPARRPSPGRQSSATSSPAGATSHRRAGSPCGTRCCG